jgi:type II secretory pathway pseudopilin PulG
MVTVMSDEVVKKSNTGIIIGIGCLVVAFLAVPVIGILSAIAIPNFVSMQYKTKRSEVPMNMTAIKTALEAYKAADNVYVTASAYPSYPSKEPRAWDISASGGFATLNWSPHEKVRGSYAISTTANTDFIITGISDVDGDGENATYIATASTSPNLTTAPDIY